MQGRYIFINGSIRNGEAYVRLWPVFIEGIPGSLESHQANGSMLPLREYEWYTNAGLRAETEDTVRQSDLSIERTSPWSQDVVLRVLLERMQARYSTNNVKGVTLSKGGGDSVKISIASE